MPKNPGEATIVRKRWFERLATWLESRGRSRMIRREKTGFHVRACGTAYRGCAPECTFQAMWDDNGRVMEDYLERFYIFSTPWVGMYLHRFWADDDDGLHDHPWHSVSVLLSGGYLEEEPERQGVPYGPTVTHLRRPLHPIFKVRSKYAAHRITVPDGTRGQCWSLFIRFGFKRRMWGFYRKRGWEAAEVQSRKDEHG